MATQSGEFIFDRGTTLVLRPGGAWIGEGSVAVPAHHICGMIATLDGRIDNLDELRLRLGATVAPREQIDIALAVFARCGIDGLHAIVGDWALVIWDAARRTLHLARDYMGARPLYYRITSRAVAWNTDLAELVTRTETADDLSDAFAARFMSLSPSLDATPYNGIRAVPPGACISIRSTGTAIHTRFWRISASEIRYRDARSYEEQLRALWRDAVLARLRTSECVWAELSGGLDSSSVACMADLLIKSGATPAPPLRLVSHATLESPEGDERRFIAEVEHQIGVSSQIVGVEEHQDHSDSERAWLTPYALHGVGLEMLRRVRAGGGRVVLSGRLGDAVMGCQPDNSVAIFDDLRRGRVLTALENLRAWSRATRAPFVEIACALLATEHHPAPDTGVALLTPRLQQMVRDAARIELPPGIRRSKRQLARMVLGYSAGARLDIPDRSPDVVYTYPFTHRPLVDFMLAIPGEQLSAPGETRSLMRRAFASFVPSRVIRRVSKGYYPPAAYRAARRGVGSTPVADFEVVARGWIDPDRLQAAIHALTAGSGETGGDIHAVLRLESWLRARRNRRFIPQRKEVNTNEVLHA